MCISVILCFPRLSVKFDNVERSQVQQVFLRIVGQGCQNVATTRTAVRIRQIKLRGNSGGLDPGFSHGIGKDTQTLDAVGFLLAGGIQHKGLPVLPKHNLKVTIDLAGHAKTFSVHALFQLCPLHQQELSGSIPFIINGSLDVFLIHMLILLSVSVPNSSAGVSTHSYRP